MTFGKDQDSEKEGRKGGTSPSELRNLRLSLALKRRWQDPEYREKHLRGLMKLNLSRT